MRLRKQFLGSAVCLLLLLVIGSGVYLLAAINTAVVTLTAGLLLFMWPMLIGKTVGYFFGA